MKWLVRRIGIKSVKDIFNFNSNQIKQVNMSLSKQSQSQSQSQSGKVLVDHSDTNSDPSNGVSLCIPRVFNNINYRRIKDVFIRMNWGYVERVDVMQLRGFKRAYVHFKAGEWNVQNPEASAALEAMKAGVDVHVTYDDPWFWKIGISRSERPSEAPKPKPKPSVTIGKMGERVVSKKVVVCGGAGGGSELKGEEKSGVEEGEVSE